MQTLILTNTDMCMHLNFASRVVLPARMLPRYESIAFKCVRSRTFPSTVGAEYVIENLYKTKPSSRIDEKS